jgi:hypothetical protein
MQYQIKCLAYAAAIKDLSMPNPFNFSDSMYLHLLIWTLFINVLSGKSANRLSVHERLWPALMFAQWLFCSVLALYLSLHGTDGDLSHDGCAGR